MNLHPKVAASGGIAALVTVIVAVLGTAGVDIPTNVAAAVVTILSFAAGYFKS